MKKLIIGAIVGLGVIVGAGLWMKRERKSDDFGGDGKKPKKKKSKTSSVSGKKAKPKSRPKKQTKRMVNKDCEALEDYRAVSGYKLTKRKRK